MKRRWSDTDETSWLRVGCFYNGSGQSRLMRGNNLRESEKLCVVKGK